MKWKDIGYVVLFFAVLSLAQISTGCKGSCATPSYDVILDSVHMGVKLGMTRQEFFDHCWLLNKSGQDITQGHHNTSVLHLDSTNFKYVVEINFYPEFGEDGIAYKLPVRFEYRPWAPWNKEAHSDQLLPEVMKFITDAYGGPLEEKTLDSGQRIWFKFDAPRLITIYVEDDHYVHVNFKNDNLKK